MTRAEECIKKIKEGLAEFDGMLYMVDLEDVDFNTLGEIKMHCESIRDWCIEKRKLALELKS